MKETRIEKYKKYRQEILENVNINESIINTHPKLKNLLKKINFNVNEITIVTDEKEKIKIDSYKEEKENKEINNFLEIISKNEKTIKKKNIINEHNSHKYDEKINSLFHEFLIEVNKNNVENTTEMFINKVELAPIKNNLGKNNGGNMKENKNKKINIAIDGPSGVGKSSVAKQVAQELNLRFINTGAMYRAIAWYFLENNIDINNQNSVFNALNDITIKLISNTQIEINNIDVSDKIFNDNISKNASLIAKNKLIREYCVNEQQNIVKLNDGILMEGRDIGSVVMPNADLKIFLTATNEVRANRRFNQAIKNGEKISEEEVLKSVIERDKQDLTRTISPLIKTDDAIEIDTSNLTLEDVVKKVINLAIERMK